MGQTTQGSAMNLVNELLAHSEWADSVLFQQLNQSPVKDHPEMRRRLAHMHDVRHAFRSMLSGGPPIYPPAGEPASFVDLLRRTTESHAGVRQFATSLTAEQGSQKIHIPFFPDPPCWITVLEGMTQVAMHTQHHRGQCMTRLSELGGKAENVDWIIWLWQRKPAPNWPVA